MHVRSYCSGNALIKGAHCFVKGIEMWLFGEYSSREKWCKLLFLWNWTTDTSGSHSLLCGEIKWTNLRHFVVACFLPGDTGVREYRSIKVWQIPINLTEMVAVGHKASLAHLYQMNFFFHFPPLSFLASYFNWHFRTLPSF